MALFHVATISPTKAEIIADWLPQQPWGPGVDEPLQVVGGYRFDDPAGRVGMETHIATSGTSVFHVPMTYRESPLVGADDALICTMEHSVLGTRWVYDGLCDPSYVVMLVAVAMTGQGEALGMAEFDGRWHVAPSPVRIHGGGWTLERVPVDGFEMVDQSAADVVLRNDRFDVTVHRRPRPGQRPRIGLSASWEGLSESVVLVDIADREATDRGSHV